MSIPAGRSDCSLPEKKRDVIGKITHYFTHKEPRELSNFVAKNIYWNNYFKNTKFEKFLMKIPCSAKLLPGIPFIALNFSCLDLLANGSELIRYSFGKAIDENTFVLLSDTLNSFCETEIYVETLKIMTVSAYALSWLNTLLGATLMFSFLIRSYQELIARDKSKGNERIVHLWSLAKNVSLFAVGVILFNCSVFGFSMMPNLLTLFATVAAFSKFTAYMIQDYSKS